MFKYYKINALEDKKQSENKDLTKANIASIMGMSPAGYQNIKTGKSVPSVEMLEKIANYFEVGVGYFFEDSEVEDYKAKEPKNLMLNESQEHYNCNSKYNPWELLHEAQNRIIELTQECAEVKIENERLKNVTATALVAQTGS